MDDINWENTEYSSWKAYADSKQANILFSRQLAKELQGKLRQATFDQFYQ